MGNPEPCQCPLLFCPLSRTLPCTTVCRAGVNSTLQYACRAYGNTNLQGSHVAAQPFDHALQLPLLGFRSPVQVEARGGGTGSEGAGRANPRAGLPPQC